MRTPEDFAWIRHAPGHEPPHVPGGEKPAKFCL
jgi:hypothetical protein